MLLKTGKTAVLTHPCYLTLPASSRAALLCVRNSRVVPCVHNMCDVSSLLRTLLQDGGCVNLGQLLATFAILTTGFR